MQQELIAERAAKVATDTGLADLHFKARRLEADEKGATELEEEVESAKTVLANAVEVAKSNVVQSSIAEYKKSDDFIG